METEKPNLNEIFGQYSAKQAMKDSLCGLTEAEQKEYCSLMITEDDIIDAMAKLAKKIIKEKIIDTERYKSIKTERQMMYAINAVIRSFNGIVEWRFDKYGWGGWYNELSESRMKGKKCVFEMWRNYTKESGKYFTIEAKGDTWLDKIQYMILIYIRKFMKVLYDKDCFDPAGYEYIFFYKRAIRICELRELEQKRANEYEGK